jgi:hypothetical protein
LEGKRGKGGKEYTEKEEEANRKIELKYTGLFI